jgi:hypothetical protein
MSDIEATFPTLYLKHISVVEPVTTVEETYNVRNIHILACFIKNVITYCRVMLRPARCSQLLLSMVLSVFRFVLSIVFRLYIHSSN